VNKPFLSILRGFCLLLVGLLSLVSCKTEDIDPAVTLSLDSLTTNRINENGGRATLFASLNGASKKAVTVRFAFGGTAVSGTDYTASATQITIPAGALKASLTIQALEDAIVEGDETIHIRIEAVEGASLLDTASLTLVISDDDSDQDNDGVPDSLDECPSDSGSVATNGCPPGFGLLINEVLYDPSNAGLAGDANGDGVYNQNEDEFIELFNNTNSPMPLEGMTVSDFVIASNTTTVRYTFGAGIVLPPKKAIIVFGGGTPTGSFGGTQVLVCSTAEGFSMNNTGERILVRSRQGNLLASFDSDALSDNPNESYTRNPDITGSFVQHSDARAGVLFSPGTRLTGAGF